jgi:hypothetical protein
MAPLVRPAWPDSARMLISQLSPGTGLAPRNAPRQAAAHRFIVRITCLTCVELWDSNPRPLACHQQAGHPSPSISAGHCPRTYAATRIDPGWLLYFPAVRIGADADGLDVDDRAGDTAVSAMRMMSLLSAWQSATTWTITSVGRAKPEHP